MDNFKTCLTKTPSIVIGIMTVFTKAPRGKFSSWQPNFLAEMRQVRFKKKNLLFLSAY